MILNLCNTIRGNEMKDEHISRYASPDKFEAWDKKEGVIWEVLGAIGFILTITLLMFVGQI